MSTFLKHEADLRDEPYELEEFHSWDNHRKVAWDCYVNSVTFYADASTVHFSIRPNHDSAGSNGQPSEVFETEIDPASSVAYQVRVLREGDHITVYGRLDTDDIVWLSEIRRRK
jgi:hypothetical protein